MRFFDFLDIFITVLFIALITNFDTLCVLVSLNLRIGCIILTELREHRP